MDIPELSDEDKRRLHLYLIRIRDGEDGSTRLNRSRTPNLSQILNVIEKRSGATTSHDISKLLCKVMHTCGGRLNSNLTDSGVVK